MMEWVLSSSILIAAVIALRQLFKGRISMRMRYTLWGLVLLRLLIPVNLFQSSISVENLTLSFAEQPEVQAITLEWTAPQQSYESAYEEVISEHWSDAAQIPATIPAVQQVQIQQEVQQKLEQSTPLYSLRQILTAVWIAGMVAVGAWLLVTNWHFSRRLTRTRHAADVSDSPVPVYISHLAETPCLFGLLHPVIYITPETAAQSHSLQYILAHETTHYRHKDHIWAFLRCICLTLHWYNPLVWLAASLSRKDCELACDEATVLRIGEENRIEYGKTLVDMTCIKRSAKAALLTATTMLSDKKSLTERIRLIAKKPTVVISAVVTAVLIAAIAVGCTFSGAADDPTETTVPPETSAPVETTEAPTETTAPPQTTAPVETTEATEPEVQIPEGAYLKGQYEIGDSVPAGQYVFFPDSYDYHATVRVTNGFDTILSEEFTGQFFWNLQDGDKLTVFNGYFFSAEDYVASANADGSYGPGMYRIGIDIPVGEYEIFHDSTVEVGRWWAFFSLSEVKHPGYSTADDPIVFSLTNQEALFLLPGTYAKPAGPPENATFIFPEATAVQALPDNYDASTLVYPYWEQGVRFAGNMTFYISIPAIYPFSEDAVACQKEIYDLFSAELNWLVRYSEDYVGRTTYLDMTGIDSSVAEDYGSTFYYGYNAAYQNGVLSIHLQLDDHLKSMPRYKVFNLDVTTGQRLDTATMLTRLGISESAAASALETYYAAMHADIDKSLDFYQSNLQKTISSENIATCQPYIGEDGSIMLLANIYTIGSGETVERLIPLTD